MLTGVGLALVPGLPTIEIAPGIRAAGDAAADHLFLGGGDELARVPFQPAPDFAARGGMRRVHHRRGRPRRPIICWASAGRRALCSARSSRRPTRWRRSSIARRLQAPRRLLVILEGEGLANDATALVLYRFAVAAVSVGVFSFGEAVGTFAAIVVGEILWGIGVGWLMLRLRRWVGDPRIEITLSVLTPFLAYWPPQQLGGSGVLATVTAGLYISWNGLRLISAATRLQGIFFWDFLNYLIEGMVFLVTGLQARSVIAGIRGYSVSELAISAALVSAVVIVARFVWLYPATYLPRWLVPAIRRKDPYAALAMAVRAGVGRRARRRLAGGGAGDSA